MKRLYIFLVLLSFLQPGISFSQVKVNGRYVSGKSPVGFENEINDFLSQDSASFPPAGAWLFAGSSTFRKWDNLQSDFNGIKVIKRGFGGSTMKALNYYLNDIVLPYRPSNIVVYEGDNDLAAGALPGEVIAGCDSFVRQVHQVLPGTTIWFVSIKPSFARKQYLGYQQEVNKQLKKFARKKGKTRFIDITGLMYDREGNLRRNLFESDSLHITRECYSIWAEYMKKRMKAGK